jgi:hypothetical protein
MQSDAAPAIWSNTMLEGLRTALTQAQRRRDNAIRKGLFRIAREESAEVERLYIAIAAAEAKPSNAELSDAKRSDQ